MNIYNETQYRSVIKTVSWRIFATLVTVLIVFIFTGKIILSLEIGAVEAIVKMIIYYLHERMWTRIYFGKKSTP